ncbi:MAG: four helix bundle protein [Deltaproteobacteria bacterium]|nr:four helix bundle protein [Deltaproteobacteria bacterium]
MIARRPKKKPTTAPTIKVTRPAKKPIEPLLTHAGIVRFLRYAKQSCTEVRSKLYVALDQRYITDAEFQDVHDHFGRTRVAIRGFIKYMAAYELGQRRKSNPER